MASQRMDPIWGHQYKDAGSISKDRWTNALRFLDTQNSWKAVQAARDQMLELLDVRPGQSVLDVGCGLGDDVTVLAELVGDDGRVTGLDINADIVAEARRRMADLGIKAEFVGGDAYELPFSDNSFDRCQSERVFAHLTDPERALEEIKRVLKPGGLVAFHDPDWHTITSVSGARDVWTTMAQANANKRASRIGSELPLLCHQAGFVDVRVEPAIWMVTADETRMMLDAFGSFPVLDGARDAGTISSDEYREASNALREAVEIGIGAGPITAITTVATKPHSIRP